jgi:hypothetical protein
VSSADITLTDIVSQTRVACQERFKWELRIGNRAMGIPSSHCSIPIS